MRRFIGILACLALLTGCEPSPPEDLGTILDEAPEIPGTDEPYEMPELDGLVAEEKPGSSHAPDQRPPDDSTDARGLRN